MDSLIKSFLSDHYTSKYNKADQLFFKIDPEKFDAEDAYNKLLFLRSKMYFDVTDKVFYYFVNKGLLCFNEEIVDYIYYLYNLRYTSDSFEFLIVDLLVGYEHSISSRIYGEVNTDNYKYFYSRFDKSSFYNDGRLINCAIKYFNTITDWLKTQDTFVSSASITFILEILSLKKGRNHNVTLELILKFIDLGKHLDTIIKYDTDIESHKEAYIDFAKKNLNLSFRGDTSMFVFEMISKSGFLNYDELKHLINFHIDESNKLIRNVLIYSDAMIENISIMETLINRFKIIKTFTVNNSITKERIKETQKKLLFIKRKYLLTQKNIESNLKQTVIHGDIPINEDDLVQHLRNHPFSLYAIMRFDFIQVLKDTILIQDEYVFSRIVTQMRLNTDNNTYAINLRTRSNQFKEYYDALIIEIVNSLEVKLKNFIEESYYDEMLQNANQSYDVMSFLVYEIIDARYKEFFGIIYTRLSIPKELYNNSYALISFLIVQIELVILSIKSTVEFQDPDKKLSELFYNEVNEKNRNGLMYVNYLLYEFTGQNLRDKFAHGETLQVEDIKKHILPILACFIFIVNYHNSRYVTDHEK